MPLKGSPPPGLEASYRVVTHPILLVTALCSMKTVTHFIFLGSKITARGDSAMKLKDLFLGRKAMIKLDNLLKSGDITLPTKVHLAKAMVFP